MNTDLATQRFQYHAHDILADNVRTTSGLGHRVHHDVAESFRRMHTFGAKPGLHSLENPIIVGTNCGVVKPSTRLVPFSQFEMPDAVPRYDRSKCDVSWSR